MKTRDVLDALAEWEAADALVGMGAALHDAYAEVARLREALGRITGMEMISEARGVAAAVPLASPPPAPAAREGAPPRLVDDLLDLARAAEEKMAKEAGSDEPHPMADDIIAYHRGESAAYRKAALMAHQAAAPAVSGGSVPAEEILALAEEWERKAEERSLWPSDRDTIEEFVKALRALAARSRGGR